MGVTGPTVVEREQYSAAVDRLAKSQVLHGSESLRKLLRYLAEHSLQNPGVPIKEYQIATEVFGRPADFDPQSDSTIRVQAGRLRLKLAEYYSSEGSDDPIVVELPKGTYILSFHHRGTNGSKPVARPGQEAAPAGPRNWVIAVALLAVLLTASVAAIGMMLTGAKPAATAHAGIFEPPPEAFQSF